MANKHASIIGPLDGLSSSLDTSLPISARIADIFLTAQSPTVQSIIVNKLNCEDILVPVLICSI